MLAPPRPSPCLSGGTHATPTSFLLPVVTSVFLLINSRPSPNTPSGRGVMSIAGLSYGVVRVEEAGSITSLTLQDVGLVMPGGMLELIGYGAAGIFDAHPSITDSL